MPEVVALRDWACNQIIAQARGVPPTLGPIEGDDGVGVEGLPD